MQVKIFNNLDELSLVAAKIVSDAIRSNSRLVLGLPTGSTPLKMYSELVRMHQEENLDFSQVTTFNLDEYVGLTDNHEHSYHMYMKRNFFDFVNLKPENCHLLNGVAQDLEKECVDYEKLIGACGGIDLQILGLGVNGHIAFNEPGSAADSHTRVVDLALDTIKANSRFFVSLDEVPKKALTMGIGTIMKAKQIILLANGEIKADAVYKSVKGPITENVPASILQKHPNCTFLIDRLAASKL